MALSEFDRNRLAEWQADAVKGDDNPVMMELPLKVVEKLMDDRLASARLVCRLLDAKADLETDLSVYRELERHRERAAKRTTA